jgi:hypothetical protein
MKCFLLVAYGLLGILLLGIFILSQSEPGWLFDFKQKIKYRDYYSWRDGTAEFPSKQFWIGFNTDRHRKDIFIGKSHQEIQRKLPLLAPVSDEDISLTEYIRARQAPGGRFSMIQGSMWLLEFDENGICIDLKMPKG